MSSESYLQNPRLKKAGVKYSYTKYEIGEYVKCQHDIEYFFETYIKIVHVDRGLVNFDLYPYQKDLLKVFQSKRFTVVKSPRQSGKSVTTLCYVLHYVLFNQNKVAAILANKQKTAIELLSRIQLAFEHLPKFLQQGVTAWNKGTLELENGCTIVSAATSSSAIRGYSINLLYLDEYAHIPQELAEDFFTSVFPTISSGESTQIIVTSTPKGYNHFYKLWTDAVECNNGFHPFNVKWDSVPGRDEKWRTRMIETMGMDKWLQEFEAEFLGSTNTLVSSRKIAELAYKNPVASIAGVDFHEMPIIGHNYNICVDVARGTGNDFSAMVVIDITTFPYKLVAKYRNNIVSPILFPDIVHNIAKKYNEASVLVEINDIGQQISDTLYFDLEYENLIFTTSKGKRGAQQISGGFSKNFQTGVRTTHLVKKLGCVTLKILLEENKLIIEDIDVIRELSNFVSKNNSYEADGQENDDLVMCLVLFSWLVNQRYFRENNNIDLRKQLYEERIRQMEEELLPIIGYADGSEYIPQDDREFDMRPSSTTVWNG